jgi:hypothetical protein
MGLGGFMETEDAYHLWGSVQLSRAHPPSSRLLTVNDDHAAMGQDPSSGALRYKTIRTDRPLLDSGTSALMNTRPRWAFNAGTAARRREAGSSRILLGDSLPCPWPSDEKIQRQAAHWEINTRTASVGENDPDPLISKLSTSPVGLRHHMLPFSFTVLVFFCKTSLVDDARQLGPSQPISDIVQLELAGRPRSPASPTPPSGTST